MGSGWSCETSWFISAELYPQQPKRQISYSHGLRALYDYVTSHELRVGVIYKTVSVLYEQFGEIFSSMSGQITDHASVTLSCHRRKQRYCGECTLPSCIRHRLTEPWTISWSNGKIDTGYTFRIISRYITFALRPVALPFIWSLQNAMFQQDILRQHVAGTD